MNFIIKSLIAFTTVFLLAGFAFAFIDQPDDSRCQTQSSTWINISSQFPAATDVENNLTYAKRLALLRAACGGVPSYIHSKRIPAQIVQLSSRSDVALGAQRALETMSSN